MALSGVVLFMFSIYLAWAALKRLDEKFFEVKKFGSRLTTLTGLKISYAKEVGASLDVKETIQDAIDSEHYKLMEQDLRASTYRLVTLIIFLAALASGSMFLAAVGFKFWYEKIQIYQDILIEYKAEHPDVKNGD